MKPTGWLKWLTALVLCPVYFGVLALGVMVLGDEDHIPSFKRQTTISRELAEMVALAVLHAAHPTAADPVFTSFEWNNLPSENKTKNLILNVKYKGRLTRADYSAKAVLELKPNGVEGGSQPMQVVAINYIDDNKIPPNRPNLDALVKRLNR